MARREVGAAHQLTGVMELLSGGGAPVLVQEAQQLQGEREGQID